MKVKFILGGFCLAGLCCVAAVALVSCKDIVRTVERPPVVRSATITAPKAGSLLPGSIPIRLKNMTASDLRVEVSESAPFTAKIDSGGPAIVFSWNEKPTTKDPVQVKVTSAIDGSTVAEFAVTPDQLDRRAYEAVGESYRFDLVKMFHCDGSGALTKSSTPALFTANANGEATMENSIMTCTDNPENVSGGAVDGVRIAFFHDSDKFVQNSYDYFEIKFRSGTSTNSTIKFHGNSSFEFLYDSGNMKATGDSDGVSTSYADSSGDWVTLGFWNNPEAAGSLYVEDFERVTKDDSANRASLSNHTNFTYMTVDSDDDSPTEIDYIAFFKKTEG